MIKHKILILVTVLWVVTLCACSHDEPKTSDGEQPGTEQPGDEQPEDPDQPSAAVEAVLGTWTGGRYITDGKNYSREEMELEFQKDGGTLLFSTWNENNNGKTVEKRYDLTYHVADDKIECQCTPAAGEPFTLLLDVKEGTLLPQTEGFNQFILKRRKPGATRVNVDTNGNIIDRSDKSLRKVWLHENGKNILDLVNMQAVQLAEPASQAYDFYQKFDEWMAQPAGSSVLQVSFIPATHSRALHWIWTVLEMTDDRMVLGSTLNGVQYIDVYYATNEAAVPKAEDVAAVLMTTDHWVYIQNYKGDVYRIDLHLYDDGTCTYETQNIFIAKGTYKLVSSSKPYLDLSFTDVHFYGAKSEWEGFYDEEPRKVKCPVTLYEHGKVGIELSPYGIRQYVGDYSGNWTVGGATDYLPVFEKPRRAR